VIVQRLGHELLAGAGLAGDQHGGVGARELLEPREQLAHLDRAADHRAEAIGVRQLDLDRVAERLELEPRSAQRDLGAGLDVDVVDPQLRHVRAVGRVKVAQAITAVVQPDLAVQPGYLGIGELNVVATARADPDHRGFDVADQPGIGAGHDLDAASPQARRRRPATNVGDPCPRAKVVDRHVAGTLPQHGSCSFLVWAVAHSESRR
jgi:hypothetical protein